MSITAEAAKFELAKLFGKSALFTSSRIYRSSVPEGLYAYDLRSSDNLSENPVTIEPFVHVNHAGTVIFSEPIVFKNVRDPHEYIHNELNRLGKYLSLDEFADKCNH
jgi:hypothetical protein